MAKRIQRIGDYNSGGGQIVSVSQDLFKIDGRKVSIDGSVVSQHEPHSAIHDHALTANGSRFITIDGIGINREGDADSCGHIRVGGSDFVNIS